MPKATQPVWATPPSASRRPQTSPKWSLWLLKLMQAVGFSAERTGTSSSNFSASRFCIIAIMTPTLPKNGSLAWSTS